eukprot:SAG11_NODE_220_length_12154_cov_92.233347_4_plen_181_part_00
MSSLLCGGVSYLYGFKYDSRRHICSICHRGGTLEVEPQDVDETLAKTSSEAIPCAYGPRWSECHRMDKHLGTSAWNEFKRYAKQHYQCGFIARFLPTSTCATIACAGPIYDSSSCPHNHIVNLENFVPNVDELGLADLHLDHEIELLQVCDIWRKLTPSNPNTWHENIDPTKLCELIFGA